MKKQNKLIAFFIAMAFLPNCGGTGTGNPEVAYLTLQSNPLAGPNAGFYLPPSKFPIELQLLAKLMHISNAYASVSSFTTFKICNDTLNLIDQNGTKIEVNGINQLSIGQGLINFDPNSVNPSIIGTIPLPTGTNIKEIDITLATVPSLCSGADYAVEFDDGVHGVKKITQNTAFKFTIAGSGKTLGSGVQNIDLLFGQIVNGMVSLGASLDDSTIQTVNTGSAD